ncbi:type I-E CRISPR-associated protein Cse1/CasA [Allorhizocola rhizosphaerae]|uniref:type I-E CRISPR-associated protein Cse1/CasA n=1 Tax=Allorhizocola rhizosphaerae TaxID=1872709 RepID=UPI000E3DB7F1|nr:type I-E CRISPR-associated protein Cse1/CasA [Allorhizocola rhizosphaerae]
MSFNLLDEPWLPVVRLDGSADEVGLVSLLRESHTLRRIVGETPPMTAALHRLVLALLYRVYQPLDEGAWTELWRAERLPAEPSASIGEPPNDARLAKYLAQYRDRFALFDAQRPFFQCPAVAGVPASSAAKLVPHRAAGNNVTLFDHTTADDEIRLTPAEAARWLVTLQAYDPGGLKSPYKTVKSSKLAPGNRFGMVLVEGRNLKETLLLNLMRYDPQGQQPRRTWPDDRPVWEADPPRPEPDIREPFGWTDLLTWSSRRVWLVPRQMGGDMYVDRVVITPGDELKAELHDNEWMAAYQRNPVQKKRTPKTSAPSYGPWYPVRLQVNRGVWRHSEELLLAPAGSEEAYQQRPLPLEHVAQMVLHGEIADDAVYTLRVFGQQLDSNKSIVEQVLEEAVAAPVALLRAEAAVAGPVIGHSVQLADRVGQELIIMERGYRARLAASLAPDRERKAGPNSLELAYWPRLAQPFDQFLWQLATTLRANRRDSTAARKWADAIRRIGQHAAQDWAEWPPRRGRPLEAAAERYEHFLSQLRRRLDAYRGYIARYLE